MAATLMQGQTLVFRESFGPGPEGLRPKSGKGRLEPTYAGKSLSGFWAEMPASKNTAWMTADGTGTPGWNFAGTSINPYEAPTPMQPLDTNGTAWCFLDLTAFRSMALLAPMNSPRTKFSVSAELMPRPILGHYTALGLTNSNVLEDNFETSAPVWVMIHEQFEGQFNSMQGIAELRTRGLAGPSVAVQVPVSYNGFNRVVLVIDPLALTATATVNGVTIGTVPVPSGTTKYVGFEGSGGADNLVVELVP